MRRKKTFIFCALYESGSFRKLIEKKSLDVCLKKNENVVLVEMYFCFFADIKSHNYVE